MSLCLSVSVKSLLQTIRFIKIIKSNEFSIKKTFNEIRISPISLEVSW